ncbi:MAG TPA: hypothetical protein VMF87_08015 [Streptosporangiaceae bacterium]|nr:hypothetical protein [Streptosporangiaceae bacterium]
MRDTRLYPTEVPGWYAAEFGAVTVQMDLNRRVVELWADCLNATEDDYDHAGATLSGLGIAQFHRMAEIEPGLIAAEADF